MPEETQQNPQNPEASQPQPIKPKRTGKRYGKIFTFFVGFLAGIVLATVLVITVPWEGTLFRGALIETPEDLALCETGSYWEPQEGACISIPDTCNALTTSKISRIANYSTIYRVSNATLSQVKTKKFECDCNAIPWNSYDEKTRECSIDVACGDGQYVSDNTSTLDDPLSEKNECKNIDITDCDFVNELAGSPGGHNMNAMTLAALPGMYTECIAMENCYLRDGVVPGFSEPEEAKFYYINGRCTPVEEVTPLREL